VENPLASTNPERAASRHRTCLGLLAVGIASDIRARRSTGHKVVALGVLDLSHVLPLDRVFARRGNQVREVVFSVSNANTYPSMQCRKDLQWAWATLTRYSAIVTARILNPVPYVGYLAQLKKFTTKTKSKMRRTKFQDWIPAL